MGFVKNTYQWGMINQINKLHERTSPAGHMNRILHRAVLSPQRVRNIQASMRSCINWHLRFTVPDTSHSMMGIRSVPEGARRSSLPLPCIFTFLLCCAKTLPFKLDSSAAGMRYGSRATRGAMMTAVALTEGRRRRGLRACAWARAGIGIWGRRRP